MTMPRRATRGAKPADGQAKWAFEVFVIDQGATHSERAVAELRQVLDKHLPEGYHLQVIDLRKQPELAVKEQLIVLPAVIRKRPGPPIRLTGGFADEARIVEAFRLDVFPPRIANREGDDSDG